MIDSINKSDETIRKKQEMRKIFKIFLIIFDQKSLNHDIWFFKEHIKICGHLVEKLK